MLWYCCKMKHQDKQCPYNAILRCVLQTIVAREYQNVLHIVNVYLQPWVSSMLCACAILFCHLWPARSTIFFHIIKGKIFGEKSIEHNFFIFSTILSETFLIIRRTEQDMIKNVIGLHIKYSLFLFDFNKTWNFSTDFRKILKYNIL